MKASQIDNLTRSIIKKAAKKKNLNIGDDNYLKFLSNPIEYVFNSYDNKIPKTLVLNHNQWIIDEINYLFKNISRKYHFLILKNPYYLTVFSKKKSLLF